MNRQLSLDALRDHDLIISQPERGYRFSLDALLLANFCGTPKPESRVIDLGTGCGVIPLVLARIHRAAYCVAVENNPAMAALAGKNVSQNGLADRITIVGDDILNLRSRFPVSTFDLVVSNPPFRAAQTGKISPLAGRDAARHETTARLADFLAIAKYLVKPGGRIYFIYHPSRLVEFISTATEMKLSLLRLRMVHGKAGAEAKMFLAELAKGRRADVTVEAPLVVYGAAGEYTDEAAGMLGGYNTKA
jgi:tRNA1Val (adenine37-N6)-methyltransferase